MVFQIERFCTHTNNKRHKNLLWKDHRILKYEYQKHWNNFEKLNRKLLKIDKILKTNEEATKHQLQQQKFKRFNYLPKKYQKLATIQANFKKSYANAIINPNEHYWSQKVHHLRKQNKTTIHKEPLTLLKKLELLYPAHTQYHCWKPPKSVPSNTKQTSTNRDKETENIRNWIQLLKQNQRQHDKQD